MRLLIVQYAGDYRETFHRLRTGGGETYHAQRYVVDSMSKLGHRIGEVAFLCCITSEAYNEVLQDGFRAIGTGLSSAEVPALIKLIEAYQPTHLVMHTPIRALFAWAARKRIRTLGLLADSFQCKSLRQCIRNHQLVGTLNHPTVEWVTNHGLNSCLSLQQIGVRPDKIIPWDWPHAITPAQFSPKPLRNPNGAWKLVYVGSISESKGVGDLIRAVAYLKAQQVAVSLRIGGSGTIAEFTQLARDLDVSDRVEFLGLVPHERVIELMREADLVAVPSRHEYPEGFPLTIYEALTSRTPIIASDHPMFAGNLQHRRNAMVFPAGKAEAIASTIQGLLSNPDLYHELSMASEAAWERLQIPVKWADLISRWAEDTPADRQWLRDHRLTSGRYDARLAEMRRQKRGHR